MSPTIAIVASNLTELLAVPVDTTKGPEFGKASPLGLLVILVLLAGTALLIRSMNSQLRKLPESFDADHPGPDQAFDEGTDDVGATDDGATDDGAGGVDATGGPTHSPSSEK